MIGYDVQQSTTNFPLMFLLVLGSDHISPATGLVPTVTISKAGAAFASPSGAVTEVGSGWYKVAGNATDTATLGPIALHATVATADPSDALYPCVAVNPQSTAYGLVLAKTTNITGFNDIAATAIVSSGAIATSGGAVATVTAVTGQLTAAQVATGLWQDATAGDFTAAGSIGRSLYTTGAVPGASGGLLVAGTNAATSFVATTGNLAGLTCTGFGSGAGAAFTSGSSGHGIVAQSSGAGSGIYAVGATTGNGITALSNGTGYGFSIVGGVTSGYGLSITVTSGAGVNIPGGITSNITGNLVGTVSTLTTYTGNTVQSGDSFGRLGAPSGASIDADILTRLATSGYTTPPTAASIASTLATSTLGAARALDAIADTSRTWTDAMHCAIDSVCAQVDASSGTNCVWKTASTGTTLRTKTLTLIAAPTTVPDKAV